MSEAREKKRVYVIDYDGINVVLDSQFIEMNNEKDAIKLAQIIEDWINL
jgi:hypothetical protein